MRSLNMNIVAVVVIKAAKLEAKIPTIFVVTTPFSFEGQGRIDVSEEGLKMLLPDTDVIIPIPNDILFTSLKADVPAKKAFLKADSSVASAEKTCLKTVRIGYAVV